MAISGKRCCDILEFPVAEKTHQHRIAFNRGASYRSVGDFHGRKMHTGLYEILTIHNRQ